MEEQLFDDRCPVVGLILRRGNYRVSPGVRDQLGCGLANASHRVEPFGLQRAVDALLNGNSGAARVAIRSPAATTWPA